MPSEAKVIQATRTWLQSVVMHYHFCPFAAAVFAADKIHYQVITEVQPQVCLQILAQECGMLDSDLQFDTSLLIYSNIAEDFKNFLLFLQWAEQLLHLQGYEGVYQLASFHPHYCFDGAKDDDAANYTNRSPYPMLHILRESSIERALQNYPQPEEIPQRNIAVARKIGTTELQKTLDTCQLISKD